MPKSHAFAGSHQEAAVLIRKTVSASKGMAELLRQIDIENERRKRDPFARARRTKGEKHQNASLRRAVSRKPM